MQIENRLLDDIARVASGAFGALAGVRNEIEDLIKQRLDRLLADMDLVPREDFEAVKAVAEKARREQELLEGRVAALEAALAESKPRRSSGAKAAPAKRRKAAAKPA
jgi:BMFP domain-containing protein YqiC